MSQFSFSLLILSTLFSPISSATFTINNNCDYTVWPGILSGAGTAPLDTTGFALDNGESRSLSVPSGWSGRLWGRTLCSTDPAGRFTCATADCGSSAVACSGGGARRGKGGNCTTTGCAADLNGMCPSALKVVQSGSDAGVACRSACEAFGSPEYCCSGAYGNPSTCRPSQYSQVFKSACPRAYSYAYDDGTSTFTCAGADYVITFCPSVPNQKEGRSDAEALPLINESMVFVSGDGGSRASRAFPMVMASVVAVLVVSWRLMI